MSHPSYAELNARFEQERQSPSPPLQLTDAVLIAMQQQWTAALTARLDAELGPTGTTPPIDAVARVWRGQAFELDTLRRLIDSHERLSPALVAEQRTELYILALAAGLCDRDDDLDEAVRLGGDYLKMVRFGPSVSAHRHVKRRRMLAKEA